jgi:hypothetical protein
MWRFRIICYIHGACFDRGNICGFVKEIPANTKKISVEPKNAHKISKIY